MSSAQTTLGYRPLEPQMIELANRNKLIEELVLRQVDAMRKNPELDQRLIQMAFTDFQMGFMALNRAIFQPTRINGMIDADTLFKDLAQ
jgi:hypothetical protein